MAVFALDHDNAIGKQVDNDLIPHNVVKAAELGALCERHAAVDVRVGDAGGHVGVVKHGAGRQGFP